MKVRHIVCLGASVFAFSVSAKAQSQAPSEDAKAKPTYEDIIVTGSRLIRNGSASPIPLTTVDKDAMAVASPMGTISDALNALPVFSGSRGQFSNPGAGATGVQGGNGAANVLNLRNLGFYRTLVMFDGHRIPPTLFNSAVDVDLIPQELISRVDVVTGGVSAVYGSDAVSGVVNYVLNRKFTGFRAHAEAGISQRGDNATRNVGMAFGAALGASGHIEVSLQHREADGILDRVGSRDWNNLPALTGAGTAANPYVLNTNVRQNNSAFGGLVNCGATCALNGQIFAANGVLSPFVHGTATGTSSAEIGGSGAYQNGSMISPMNSTQAFIRVDEDVSDNLHFFAQGGLNVKFNTSYSGWNTLNNVVLSSTNAFLPASYQTALAAAGQSTFKLSETMANAPRQQNRAKTTQLYFNAGLEGKLGTFKWDATYTHGASTLNTTVSNIVNQQNLFAALDVVNVGGTNKCYAATQAATASAYANCVPLNVFGPSAAGMDALSYIMGSERFTTHTIMDAADASLRGTLLHNWAGPISVALSAEWRKLSFDAASSVLPTSYIDCTNLRYNCTATTTLFTNTYPQSGKVSQSVREGAIELEVPLLKDLPLARSLDLNGAARYTDYSTSGHYTTWKVGAVWDVNGAIKLRGTVSSDIRAPTLYDLFQPVVTVPGNFADTLTGKTVFVPSINYGNPALTAERGYTYTAGIVLKPGFLRGVTLTVDTYHTIINNAITTVQGWNSAIQAACYASGGSSPYCSLQSRPGSLSNTAATNAFTAVYAAPINIAQVRTYGLDVEADYAGHLFNRALNLRLLANYQPHIYYIQPGVAITDQGGAGWGANGLMPSPSLQISGIASYQLSESLKIDLFERYRNAFKLSGVVGHVVASPKVPAFATTNLTLTFNTGAVLAVKDSAFYLSITNLFDAKPPVTGYYSGSGSAGSSYEFADDPQGRAFAFGFRVKG